MRRSKGAALRTPRFTESDLQDAFNRAVQLATESRERDAERLLRKLRVAALRGGFESIARAILETRLTVMIASSSPHSSRVPLLRKLIEECGDATARYHYELGCSLRMLGRVDEATEAFTQAVNATTNDAPLYSKLSAMELRRLSFER